MGESRPSIQVVQRSLIFGAVAGVLLGCVVGAGLVGLYIRQYPPVYAGGAYPSELTPNYQDNYLAMVIDSYIVNRQPEVAQERLKTFDQTTKIRALGRRSAIYVSSGRAVEAQAVNELAVALKTAESWSPETISAIASELAAEFKDDSAKAQAITSFASALGQVPVEAGQVQPAAPPPAEAAPAEGGGFSWLTALLCCLGLLLFALGAFVLYQRFGAKKKVAVEPQKIWTGGTTEPLKSWSGTYTLGQDNFDEFFTIETPDGAFLGESGIGILDTVPHTSPKQVISFDVGLFDKTDITTLSRVVMSEKAYYDQTLRAKIEANPQAEAILAEPGKQFTLETSAMRVEAKIQEMAYGSGNEYFEKLKIKLDVFVKEGADLKIGQMDVPDEYRV
ncbi:MAG: hypothetical protein AB1801_20850 [Chloroflexota bacterium]